MGGFDDQPAQRGGDFRLGIDDAAALAVAVFSGDARQAQAPNLIAPPMDAGHADAGHDGADFIGYVQFAAVIADDRGHQRLAGQPLDRVQDRQFGVQPVAGLSGQQRGGGVAVSLDDGV